MGNRHGRPTRPELDREKVATEAEKHIDLASISDDVVALEMQLAETAELYEAAKHDRSYVASRNLQRDMRELQDKIRALRAEEARVARDHIDADIEEAIRELEQIPEHVRAQILGHFDAPTVTH